MTPAWKTQPHYTPVPTYRKGPQGFIDPTARGLKRGSQMWSHTPSQCGAPSETPDEPQVRGGG